MLKLLSKSRQGARIHKVYDEAQTPYCRLIKSGVLTVDKQLELANIYNALNPVVLLEQITQGQRYLAELGEKTAPVLPNIHEKSVTLFMKQLT